MVIPLKICQNRAVRRSKTDSRFQPGELEEPDVTWVGCPEKELGSYPRIRIPVPERPGTRWVRRMPGTPGSGGLRGAPRAAAGGRQRKGAPWSRKKQSPISRSGLLQRRSKEMRIVRIFLSALAFLALAASSTADLPSKEYEKHLHRGRELLDKKNYERAIVELKKAESLAPGQTIAALTTLHRAYEQTGQPDEAIKACESFIESAKAPGLKAKAYNLLGIWLLRQASKEAGKLTESEQAFRKALELSSGKAYNARISLAEVLNRDGNEEEALSVLKEYPPYDPADSRGSLPLGPVSDHTYDQLTELLLSRDPEPPILLWGSVEPPTKKHARQPRYTKTARKKGTQGVVIVRAIIDKEGRVTTAEVIKGLPNGLAEEAIQAIKGWSFRPATFRGRPVAVYYNLSVNFRLQ